MLHAYTLAGFKDSLHSIGLIKKLQREGVKAYQPGYILSNSKRHALMPEHVSDHSLTDSRMASGVDVSIFISSRAGRFAHIMQQCRCKEQRAFLWRELAPCSQLHECCCDHPSMHQDIPLGVKNGIL